MFDSAHVYALWYPSTSCALALEQVSADSICVVCRSSSPMSDSDGNQYDSFGINRELMVLHHLSNIGIVTLGIVTHMTYCHVDSN